MTMPTDTPSAMLVWEVPEWGGSASALTPFGLRYNVAENTDDQWEATFDGDEIGDDTYPDPASARAACEADYRERVEAMARAAGWVPAGEWIAPFDAFAEMRREIEDERAEVARLRALLERVVEAFLIVLAPPGAALAAAPLAPTPAAPAVSADAIRAEIARCEADKQHLTSMLGGAGVSDHEVAVLETWVAAYEEFAARLTALLPKPAGEGLPSPSPAGGAT